MIKNVIFDMGCVLIHFSRNEFMSKLNLDNPEDEKLLMRETYLSVGWPMMDRGYLDEQGLYERACANLPERLHKYAHELIFEWNKWSYEIPGMEELLSKLKKNGYQIILLSNTSLRQKEYWPNLKVSRYFDKTYISAKIKMMKPEKEIYQYVLNDADIVAEESVFIDDVPFNVEAAMLCGIHGVVYYRDQKKLIEDLKELGIKI